MLQARLLDNVVGICVGHTPPITMSGVIIKTSNDIMCNSRGVCRLTDLVIGYCGHTGIMVSSSNLSFANNLGLCRVGDSFSGTFSGSIINGSPNVLTG